MRTPATLALLLLAACAASGRPGVDPDWNEIQRQRLERLRAPRRAADAVVALLGRPPRDLTQDPRPATATREGPAAPPVQPVASGAVPRQFRSPLQPLVVRGAVGVGEVAVRSQGTMLDDRTSAAFARFAVESGTGAALQLDAWSSSDDLFAGVRINDGVMPADADATLRGVDVFPHVRTDLVDGSRFALPLRVGLFADWQRLDHEAAAVERRWLSLGPRLVLEPSLRLLGDDGDRLELFGRVGGDLGPAWFEECYRGGDDRDVTTRWTGEVGAGLRAHVGGMQAELGYGLQHTWFGSTDTDLLGSPSHTEVQRQQAYFGLGVRF
jgi:hypothetical protein